MTMHNYSRAKIGGAKKKIGSVEKKFRRLDIYTYGRIRAVRAVTHGRAGNGRSVRMNRARPRVARYVRHD